MTIVIVVPSKSAPYGIGMAAPPLQMPERDARRVTPRAQMNERGRNQLLNTPRGPLESIIESLIHGKI